MAAFRPSLSRNEKESEKSIIVELFEFTIGIVGACAVIYFLLGFALDIVIDKLPQEFEEALVQLIDEDDYESPYYFVEAEIEAQEMLNVMVKKVAKDKSFRLHIANEPEMNSFVLPGQHIVINSGLMQELKTENQLAFVLAHELGHYKGEDHLKATGRPAIFVFMSISLFGIDSGITGLFTSLMDFEDVSFSRQQEAAADQFAVDMLHRQYGHVSGAVDFFRILTKTQGSSKYLEYNSTHPVDETRIETLKTYIRSSSYSSGNQLELNPIIFRTYLFNK